MSNDNETPLTDAHCGIREGDDPENFFCTVKFARDLERQLAEARDWNADYRQQLDSLDDELNSLETQLVEARKDTERLDWLGQDFSSGVGLHGNEQRIKFWLKGRFPDLRQAIDNAMKEDER
jgi:septal ring factor EnvC (AmiA/AmiB activator)